MPPLEFLLFTIFSLYTLKEKIFAHQILLNILSDSSPKMVSRFLFLTIISEFIQFLLKIFFAIAVLIWWGNLFQKYITLLAKKKKKNPIGWLT